MWVIGDECPSITGELILECCWVVSMGDPVALWLWRLAADRVTRGRRLALVALLCLAGSLGRRKQSSGDVAISTRRLIEETNNRQWFGFRSPLESAMISDNRCSNRRWHCL